MPTRLSNEELEKHDLQCEVRIDGYAEQCTCKPIEMNDEQYGELLTELDALAEQEPFWLEFERRGVQLEVYSAFQKHKTGLFECFVQGGNQIGKTASMQEILKDALTRSNKYRNWPKRKLHILAISPKQNLQEAGIQKQMLEYNPTWMKHHMLGKPSLKGQSKAWAGVKFDNGDFLQFETFDAGERYIETVTCDLIICDEGMEFYNFYPYLFQRIVNKKGCLYWSMIPPPPFREMYKKIFEKKLKGVPISPIREVVGAYRELDGMIGTSVWYIEANGLEAYEHCKYEMPKRLFLQKTCGLNVGSGSLVYDEFSEDLNIIPETTECKLGEKVFSLKKIPEEWARFIWIDWANTDNPEDGDPRKQRKTVGIFCAIPPPGTRVILPDKTEVVSEDGDEVLVIYNGYESKKRRLATEHAKLIVDLWEDRGWWQEFPNEIILDNATGVRDGTSDRSVFEDMFKVFEKAGCSRVYRTRKKDRQSREGKELIGHDAVHAKIKKRKLLIVKNGKTEFIIDSFLCYENDPDTNLPQTFGDDEQDATRYGVNSKPRYEDPANLEPSPFLQDREDGVMIERIMGNRKSYTSKYLNQKVTSFARRY